MEYRCRKVGKFGPHPVYQNKKGEYYSIQGYGNIIEINQVKKDKNEFWFKKRKKIVKRGGMEEYGGLSKSEIIKLGKKVIGC